MVTSERGHHGVFGEVVCIASVVEAARSEHVSGIAILYNA